MELYSLLLVLSCAMLSSYAWSMPFYPAHAHAVHRMPHRFIRHVRHVHPPNLQPYRIPAPAPVLPVREPTEEQRRERPKRDHDYEHDHDHDHDHGHDRDQKGVTGPIHTFVKTDKNANYKWGVRHHVGSKFAS